jgi:hypothetical protein
MTARLRAKSGEAKARRLTNRFGDDKRNGGGAAGDRSPPRLPRNASHASASGQVRIADRVAFARPFHDRDCAGGAPAADRIAAARRALFVKSFDCSGEERRSPSLSPMRVDAEARAPFHWLALGQRED